ARQRLPDPQRQGPARLQPLPQPERAEPAVLVVHSGDTARGGKLEPASHRLDVLVVGGAEVALLEPPGRLLAEESRRPARLVPLSDAALDLEVAVREREGGRVEPERVVVLGEQRRRRRAGDLVEVPTCRLLRPAAAAPAEAPQRASLAALGAG